VLRAITRGRELLVGMLPALVGFSIALLASGALGPLFRRAGTAVPARRGSLPPPRRRPPPPPQQQPPQRRRDAPPPPPLDTDAYDDDEASDDDDYGSD
jgi:hypothetical protein